MISPTSGRYEYGVPGKSLSSMSGTFGEGRVNSGVEGELRTADLLRHLQGGRRPQNRFTVVHDVVIKTSRVTVNLDHVVVAGNEVFIIDSKVWYPGVILTLQGRTWIYRPKNIRDEYHGGLQRAEYLDGQALRAEEQMLKQWLSSNHIIARVNQPIMVVWPTKNKRHPNTRLYRPRNGEKVLHGGDRARRYLDSAIPNKAANSLVLDCVVRLCSHG